MLTEAFEFPFTKPNQTLPLNQLWLFILRRLLRDIYIVSCTIESLQKATWYIRKDQAFSFLIEVYRFEKISYSHAPRMKCRYL